jgi:hypothetical protein
MALTKITNHVIADTGVTAGTYGAAASVPVLTINEQGQITAASTTAVAGVDSVTYSTTTSVLTINTSDGGSHSVNLQVGDTPITPGTYGSSSQVPVIEVDQQGQVVAISTTAVAGVSSTDYNTSTGVLTINTSDGGSFTEDLGVGTGDSPTFVDLTVDSIRLTGGTGDQGTLSWNNSDKTLDLIQNNTTLQLGQETHFMIRNATGSTIEDGTFLGFTGVTVGSNRIMAGPFDASTMGPHQMVGFATETISNGVNGLATTFGYVRGLDTRGTAPSGMAVGDEDWSVGDVLYPHPTVPGKLTTVEPTTGFKAHVGVITNRHQNAGEIFVRVTPINENISTGYIDLTPADPGPDHVEGRIYYNDEYKALTVYNDIVGSSLQVGLEEWIRVYNNSGSNIPNGTPLYATGAVGEVMTVSPANAATEAASRVIGVATNDIANNSQGVATVRGLISGIDTSGLTAGQPVHLAPAGGFQNAAPTYPYFPVDLGGCVVSDATNGYIYIRIENHVFEQIRITGNTHMDGNLQIDGDLVVTGTQSVVSQSSLSVDNSFVYLNSGDTIGLENTSFSGTGLNDAYFNNHYEGATTKTFYVRIDGVGTGTGGVDTFEWSTDNFATTEATDVDLVEEVLLSDNICIHFNATTGHTLGDTWSGTAAPVNVDSGWFSNRNTGTSGVGYTHMGIYFDVSDNKFKVVEEYDPEPSGTIDTGHASYNAGTFVADTFEGNLIGNVTGNVSSINNHTTDALGEGTSNLYFTDARARSAITKATIDALNVDADTLDGLNSTQFLRSDVDDSVTGKLTFNRTGEVARFGSSTDADKWITIGNQDGSGEWQIKFVGSTSGSGGNELRFESAWTGKYVQLDHDGNFEYYDGSTTHKVWTGANDGSGSGLDADLLDGLQASQFLRSDANDTATGNIKFSSAGTYSAGLQNAKVAIEQVNASVQLLLGRSNNVDSAWFTEFGTDSTGYHVWPGGYVAAGNGKSTHFDFNGNVGIGDTTPSYKLDVNGTIRATGDVIADSDRRLKSEIKPITNAVDTVKALSGKSYIKDDKPSIGLIAQEVEEVMPFMVHTASDEMGTKSVNYQNMVALLIEAVKEQQEQIDELKRLLEAK